MIFSGSNSYGGATTINGASGGPGTLLITGQLSSTGACTVAANASLGGPGIIMGPVTVQADGTLQPGLGGTDTSTLTISNQLTLAGNAIFALNRTNSQNAANVAGLTAVSYGGTLTLSNVGPAMQVGDTFTLFSAASFSGGFGSISPATPGAGLFWDLSKLFVTGTVSVAALPAVTVVPASTNLVYGTSAVLTNQCLRLHPAAVTNGMITATSPSPVPPMRC